MPKPLWPKPLWPKPLWPKQWPTVAHAIATATDDALTAARTATADEFGAATGELAVLPFERVAAVQFRIVRELMETLHPDGLSGDDVSEVLERCARAVAPWWPKLDVQSLAVVLTGALGVGEVEETPSTRDRVATIASATLVIADLVAAANVSSTDYIKRAVNDIARSECIEMP